MRQASDDSPDFYMSWQEPGEPEHAGQHVSWILYCSQEDSALEVEGQKTRETPVNEHNKGLSLIVCLQREYPAVRYEIAAALLCHEIVIYPESLQASCVLIVLIPHRLNQTL